VGEEDEEDKNNSEERRADTDRWGVLSINELDDKICVEVIKDMDSFLVHSYHSTLLFKSSFLVVV
jgi:hypothetical protein